jgi:hypothetical protein
MPVHGGYVHVPIMSAAPHVDSWIDVIMPLLRVVNRLRPSRKNSVDFQNISEAQDSGWYIMIHDVLDINQLCATSHGDS